MPNKNTTNNMKISLAAFNKEELIQIARVGEFWKITPGLWWHGRNEALELTPKEDVLFDVNDIRRFVAEIKRTVKEKSKNSIKLLLAFRKNKACLSISMHFMQPGDKFYEEEFKDTFCLKIGISANESVISVNSYPSEPGDWPYSECVRVGDSIFRFLKGYFTVEQLEEFVRKLEEEIKSF